jgi:predicted MPP superfamily phosphohydrolase
LIAGDFTVGYAPHDFSEGASALAARLTRLDAHLGVVAVLGNHDYWVSADAIRSALVTVGIVVLENQALRRGALAIVGVGDRFSGHDDVSQALAAAGSLGGVPVVLTHSPDVVPDLPSGFPVVLAGHTHCGQINLPWWGPLIARSPHEHWRPPYDPHYRCGVVRDPGRLTVVSAGLGSGTIPLRLGAMPDWWLLTFDSSRSAN